MHQPQFLRQLNNIKHTDLFVLLLGYKDCTSGYKNNPKTQ